MGGRKIAFFEKLDSSTFSQAEDCLKDGFIAYFFGNPPKKRPAWFESHQKKGSLIAISGIELPYSLFLNAWKLAHEKIDEVFNVLFGDSASIKNSVALFRNKDIIDLYRKALYSEFRRHCEHGFVINHICSEQDPSECVFYTSDNLDLFKRSHSSIDKRVDVMLVRPGTMAAIKKTVTNFLYILYPVYLLLARFGGINLDNNRKRFVLGLNINHPKNLFLMNYYTETVMLHDSELPPSKVIFLDESGPINKGEYDKRKYNYFLVKEQRIPFSLNFVSKVFRRLFPYLIKSLLSISEHALVLRTSAKATSDFLVWNLICDRYDMRNYMRWYVPDNLSKICVLRENNIKAWYIYPDCYTGDYHSGWDETLTMHPTYTFMHYDVGVFYGDKIARHFKHQRNYFREFLLNGVLFSQIDLEIMENRLPSPIHDIFNSQFSSDDYTVVAVFDTSFFNHTVYKTGDGLSFAEDILRFLDDNPNLVVLFKAKKEREFNTDLSSLYNKLEAHPRCRVFYRYDEDGISAPEVIAKSDFVITAAFSSPTIEALCSGKRAIYYDINNKHPGKRFYFNNFPYLVAHNYNELSHLLNYWMKRATEKEFKSYLEKYIKPEFDPYLDGKALSRLRAAIRRGDPE